MGDKLIEKLVQALPDDALDDLNALLDKEDLKPREIKEFLIAHGVDPQTVAEDFKKEMA